MEVRVLHPRLRKSVPVYHQSNPFNIKSAVNLDENGKLLNYYTNRTVNRISSGNGSAIVGIEKVIIPNNEIEFRKGFEWLSDPDTRAYEFIYGYKLNATYDDDNRRYDLTKRSIHSHLDPIVDIHLMEGFRNSHKIGILNSSKQYRKYITENGIIRRNDFDLDRFGVVPNIRYYTAHNPSANQIARELFLPYCYILSNYEYSQYQEGPKTVESISRWLEEDLDSKMIKDFTGRYMSTYYKALDTNARFIPYGLMFYNKRLNSFAKILSSYFDWSTLYPFNIATKFTATGRAPVNSVVISNTKDKIVNEMDILEDTLENAF